MASPQIAASLSSGAAIRSAGDKSSSSYETTADDLSVPHNFTSFFDRRDGRRPLAWRTGLPPSAGGLGLLDLHAKGNLSSTTAPASRGRTRDARDSAERIRYDMNDFVKATVWANHDMLRLRPSALEGGQQKAVFVDCGTPLPAWLRHTDGEHLHVHADGSAHMILSLADAATAVESGWAERLPEANDSTTTPEPLLGYVSVHAPRCASELADWKRLALASVRFCTHTSRELCIRRPERL